MLDMKRVRENPRDIEEKIQRKDPEASLQKVLELDSLYRAKKTVADDLKSKRNEYSKQIGDKKRNGEPVKELMSEVSSISDQVHALDREIHPLEEQLKLELAKLPNLPDDDIKCASDPKENVLLKEWGKKPSFSFAFKNHLELNEKLHLFDFERGAKISGAGWPIYRGMGARLEFALINYMIGMHIKNGFEQWMLPALVRPETLFGSGQLPKFENQQFKISDDDYHLYLIPTAEVPLNGLHIDEILEEDQLPLKYIAYTPCFRREAGAAGEKERGLIRTHQFNKVEMFAYTKPEKSKEMFEQLVTSAEEVLQGLDLHYRNMLLVTGDMSFGGARTIDLEVWLPGQDRYYEVSSVSNCTDFQARRSQIRFRRKQEKKPELVHTLNGSGLATSRLMVALLENNQQEDGSVIIPKVLRPYLDNQEMLTL